MIGAPRKPPDRRVVRVHCAFRADLLARVERAADAAGVSVAEWIRYAAVERLRATA